MATLAPYRTAAQMKLHPDWTVQWANTFPDKKMPEDMMSNERFSQRVGQLIMQQVRGHSGIGNMPEGEKGPQLKFLLSCRSEVILRLLGALWLAPVLAPQLPNAAVRQKYDLHDRNELSLILQYCEQTTVNVVGALASAASLEVEGLLCLHAWWAQFDRTLIDRLTLLYPEPPTTRGPSLMRSLLVSRALSDETAQELFVA
ncbi:hypothetical protein [Yoonia sp.]|uniref:hypothetical protein n=1 Tax=Yoonia sp. TaxID=2212373 RepID=UPI0025E144E2|nr:hypothetical protein [Yoonia sp.]